jgi:hypothetical protein
VQRLHSTASCVLTTAVLMPDLRAILLTLSLSLLLLLLSAASVCCFCLLLLSAVAAVDQWREHAAGMGPAVHPLPPPVKWRVAGSMRPSVRG